MGKEKNFILSIIMTFKWLGFNLQTKQRMGTRTDISGSTYTTTRR